MFILVLMKQFGKTYQFKKKILVANEYTISSCGDESVLDLDDGDGCTVL